MQDQTIEEKYSVARSLFARNLNMLIKHAKHLAEAHPEAKERRRYARRATQKGLEELTGVSDSAISRYQNAQVDAPIHHVEALAQAFDLQAWEMLYPNLGPDSPPEVMSARQVQELQEILAAAAKLLPKVSPDANDKGGDGRGPDGSPNR